MVNNGKILLNRKSMDMPTTKINEGETAEAAALRTAKEIGIDASIDRFFALNFFADRQVYTYLCKIKSSDRLKKDYNWISYDELVGDQISQNLAAIIDKIKVIL